MSLEFTSLLCYGIAPDAFLFLSLATNKLGINCTTIWLSDTMDIAGGGGWGAVLWPPPVAQPKGQQNEYFT